MTRIPPPKRKAAGKPAPKLRGQRQQVTITLPPDLVADVDAIATKESRSRARMVEVVLREFVQSYQRRSAAA
jgi:metal-responsive CopG/Arc/MetJ family transcriptional regulator